MRKDKIISFITKNQSFNDFPEVIDWINKTDENKNEFIRYKNLWALMQNGNEMTDSQVKEGLKQIKKNSKQKAIKSGYIKFMRYAALLVFALFVGYFAGNWESDTEVALNEIFVPKGSRSSVVLPDGTRVWLNNGSKLIYPDQFKGKNRVVELAGEGFFEVTHDKKQPFIVKIGENRIKVLGTKFALLAYPFDDIIKAELVAGKIQFDIKKDNGKDEYQSYVLNPLQSLTFNKTSGKLQESKVSDGFYEYWMNGVYEFTNETFESLAKRIERIYNVKIIFKNESLKKRLFTGTLSIDDNIYTMLEVFKQASGKPFSYTHIGNQIIIGK